MILLYAIMCTANIQIHQYIINLPGFALIYKSAEITVGYLREQNQNKNSAIKQTLGGVMIGFIQRVY